MGTVTGKDDRTFIHIRMYVPFQYTCQCSTRMTSTFTSTVFS